MRIERRCCVAWIALLAVAPHVAAEPQSEGGGSDFASLARTLRTDETVLVTRVSGDVVRGRVRSLAPLTLDALEQVSGGRKESLGLTSLELAEADVAKLVVLRKDPLWNGALIGLGVGAAVVIAADCNSPDCDEIQAVAVPLTLALGAGLGALIDSLRKEEKLLYAAAPRGSQLSIVPLIDADRRGLLVRLQWGR